MRLSFLALQVLARFPSSPVVVWCDCMKLGRMTKTDVNDTTELIECVLKKRGAKAAALCIAPYLTSEKIQNGQRGEQRHTPIFGCWFLLLL